MLTTDRQHAEDLLQSTLERTYQHWRRVAVAQAPDAYVQRIMINLANDRWRSRRHVVEEALDAAAPMGSEGDCGTGHVEQRDLPGASTAAPAGRDARGPGAALLGDMSEAETAAVMGCSVGTVKSQASRGLRKLREAIDRGPNVIDLPKRSAS